MGDKNDSIASHIRIPVIETLSMSFGSMGGRSTSLTIREIEMAEKIFGKSIILSDVRIVSTAFIAAPTTLGNNIRMEPNLPKERYDHTLIHELTHVWQFQNRGSSYISNSLMNQGASMISNWGDRNKAYEYTISPGQSFSYYTAEQQASIVEDYFKRNYYKEEYQKYYNDHPEKKTDAWYQEYLKYQKLLDEVRAADPKSAILPTHIDKYYEALYGNTYKNDRIFDSHPYDRTNEPRAIPIIRLEWHW